MAYNVTFNIWKNLGSDAYTKVIAETSGTGDGSATSFDLDHDNVISGSVTVYTDSSEISSSEYSLNLDNGKINFTGSTPDSGSIVTADYSYADIPDSWVQEILNQANSELYYLTNRIFDSTSVTDEYHDVDREQTEFFLKNYPALTLSSVQVNTVSDVTSTPGWSSSTEGLGNDYLVDLDIGRIRFIDNKPEKGLNRLKVSYSYGYSDIPDIVKELEILLATRKMINSAVYKSIIKGRDSFTPIRLEEIENRINQIVGLLRKTNIEPI